jgi:hypothetical protein
MAPPLILTAALAGCATPGATPAPGRAPVQVGGSVGYADGAAARQQAEAICAARGARLVTSIRDRFVAGTWEFVEGCA